MALRSIHRQEIPKSKGRMTETRSRMVSDEGRQHTSRGDVPGKGLITCPSKTRFVRHVCLLAVVEEYMSSACPILESKRGQEGCRNSRDFSSGYGRFTIDLRRATCEWKSNVSLIVVFRGASLVASPRPRFSSFHTAFCTDQPRSGTASHRCKIQGRISHLASLLTRTWSTQHGIPRPPDDIYPSRRPIDARTIASSGPAEVDSRCFLLNRTGRPRRRRELQNGASERTQATASMDRRPRKQE